MFDQVPFIGRENELTLIDKLINEISTLRILFIQGTGGIGKTRLLQEVREKYNSNRKTHLIASEIIDFDDHTLHIPENIWSRIAQVLDESTFKPYLNTSLDYRKMEMNGVSSGRLSKILLENNEIFIDCFNSISKNRRVVLFFDTTDALKETDLFSYLFKLCIHFKNALLLLTGRNARKIGVSLQAKISKKIAYLDFFDIAYIIDLLPFEEKAGEEYLNKKQETLRINLKPEIAQKVLLMAGGRPILIDLAVEWLAREIPIDWLADSSLEELKSLSEDEMKARRKEFEHQLVSRIVQLRFQMDRLILFMSRVYPLDTGMIANLLDMDENEIEKLLTDAKTYIFIKYIPDGGITLHDEMRRIVNDYAWPEVDPESSWRCRDSELAVKYFESAIQTLVKKSAELENEERNARERTDFEAELKAFAKRVAFD